MTPRNTRRRWASAGTASASAGIALFLAATWLFTPFGCAEELTGLKKPRWKQLSEAYGFLLGQQRSLAQIEQQFPELRRNVKQVWFAFYSGPLGNSLAGIEDEMGRLYGEKWSELKPQMDAQMADLLAQQTIDRNQAQEFLDEVAARAKGDIPEEIRSTLLSTVPRYVKFPDEELLDGWKQTFRTKDHPTAKGVDFSISLPASWSRSEGNRPDMVQLFQSSGGHGSLMCSATVKTLPSITKAERDDFFRADSLSDMCGKTGKALSTATVTLNGRRTGLVVCDGVQEWSSVRVAMRTTNYFVISGRAMILLQFMAFQRADSKDSLDDLQARAFPLFQAAANSLVLYRRNE